MRNIQNLIFVFLILIISICLVIYGISMPSGEVAIVSISDGDTIKISLDKNKIHHINKGKLPVTLEVLDGKIRFINSACPDKICENYGWIFKEEDSAICAPSRVVVSIEK